jgi:hypothetical protein
LSLGYELASGAELSQSSGEPEDPLTGLKVANFLSLKPFARLAQPPRYSSQPVLRPLNGQLRSKSHNDRAFEMIPFRFVDAGGSASTKSWCRYQTGILFPLRESGAINHI